MNPELRKQKLIDIITVCRDMNLFDSIETFSLAVVTLINGGATDDSDKLAFAELSGGYIIEQTKKLIEERKSNEKA
jgi:hypothetical protein